MHWRAGPGGRPVACDGAVSANRRWRQQWRCTELLLLVAAALLLAVPVAAQAAELTAASPAGSTPPAAPATAAASPAPAATSAVANTSSAASNSTGSSGSNSTSSSSSTAPPTAAVSGSPATAASAPPTATVPPAAAVPAPSPSPPAAASSAPTPSPTASPTASTNTTISTAAAPAAAVPSTPAPTPSPATPAAAAPASTPAPSSSPVPAAVSAPAPGPAQPPLQELSLVLRLAGTGLMPWGKAKGDTVLATLVSALQGGGLPLSGEDLVLISADDGTSSVRGSSGRRRLADAASSSGSSVAAIPSLYTLTQEVEVQAVVTAQPTNPQSREAVQAVFVAACISGQMAMQLREAGISVSQAIPLAVYEGVADPPENLAPLTAASTSTTVSSPPAATAKDRRSPPSETAIIAIGASVGCALAFTVGMLAYLRYRKIGADSNASGGYVYDKSSSKQSPAPAPRRTASGGSIDLEGACTPRFRQPITPRRSALKHGASSGAFNVSSGSTGAGGGAFHLHAVQAGLTAQRAGPQLVPGVHLLPRAPSSTAGSGGGGSLAGGASSLAGSAGPRMPASVGRSMAAVQDMQDARRAAYLAQQAAEQAAMREYLKSKPPQVIWEGEGSPTAARVAEQLARQQSRLGRHGRQAHHPHYRAGGGGGGSSSGAHSHASRPGSFTTGPSAPPSARPSAPPSETGLTFSEISAAATDVGPGSGIHPYSHSIHSTMHSARSHLSVGSSRDGGGSSVGGGGSGAGQLLPEALKRAAAKVQPGSPRRSAARAKGPFATKDLDSSSLQHGPSRLARTSSAPVEAVVDAATGDALHDRSQLTGAWVSTGGHISLQQARAAASAEAAGQEGPEPAAHV